ncbi:MAG: hypothetical protein ABIG69_14785 [Bacteroidota bacterium]
MNPAASDLILWKQTKGLFCFQTTSPNIRKKMDGRKTFCLGAYSTSHKFWIYYCDLPSTASAVSRFKGLTGRKPTYKYDDGIFY